MKKVLLLPSSIFMLIIFSLNTNQLNAQTDSAYFYLNGIQQMFYQQPDVYSFRKTDKSEYTNTLSTAVVDKKEYKSDGMNYIFFKPTATLADIQAIISSVSSDPLFEKEFMVLTQDWNTDFTAQDYLGTDLQIEVVFTNQNITSAEVNTFAINNNLTIFYESPFAGGVYVFDVNPIPEVEAFSDPKLSIKRAAHIWEQNSSLVSKVMPSIRIFEPNDPNDPFYNLMWSHENDGTISCGNTGTAGADAKIDRAWNLNDEFGYGQSFSGQGVIVGVIDFHGYQYTHPDLQGQLLPGFNSISGANYGAFTTDIIVDDTQAHGNNVCGVIVAKLGNNEGIAGVAYNAKVFPTLMAGTSAQISICFGQCLAYGAGTDDKVDIINMSWGNSVNTTEAQAQAFAYYTNLKACYDADIVLINSAGNSDGSLTQAPSVLSEVFSVGATNLDDQRKHGSDGFGSWGGSYWSGMDVSAPGVCMPSTDFTGSIGYSSGNYFSFGGTSGAAPLVSGIAALLLEKDPTLTNEEVYQAIREGAEKVGGYTYGTNGKTLQMGFGRVNAYNVVYQIAAPIDNVNEIDFSITNPINSELVINLENIENYSIKIFDALGKLLLETNLRNDKSSINLESFSNGIYFLNVTESESQNSTSKKFIKL